MAATAKLVGNILTISFSYSGPVKLVQDIATNAAHALWDQADQPVGFESLSDNQKLAILDQYILSKLNELATQNYVGVALRTAQLAAENEAKVNLTL